MSGQRFCRFCGAPLAEDSLFCENCGRKIEEIDAAAQEAAAEVVPAVEEAAPAAEEAPVEVTAAAEEIAEAVAEPAEEAAPAVEAAVEEVAEAAEEAVSETETVAEEVREGAAPVVEEVAEAAPAAMTFGSTEGFTEAPAAPAAEGFTEAPAAEGFTEAPAAPAAEGFTEAPAADGFTAAPAADGFTAAPAAGGFQQAPAPDPYATNVNAAGDSAFNAPPMPVKQPKSKKKFIIPAVIFGVVLLLAGAYFALAGRTTDVDISDCIDISISGYEGSATAQGDLDHSAVVSKLEEAGCDIVEARMIASSISLDCSPAYDLKNGDTVTCTVSWDQDLATENHINITTTSVTKTVADLKDKPVNRMVGTWDAVLIKSKSRGVTMTPAEADLKFEVTFNENGRVTALTNGEDDGAATWTYEGGIVTLNSNGTIMKGKINGKNQLELNLNEDIVVTMEKRK